MTRFFKRLTYLCLFLASSLLCAQSLEIDNIKNEIKLHQESLQKDKLLLKTIPEKKLSISGANALLEGLSLRNKQLVFQKNYLLNKIEFTKTALARLLQKESDITQRLNHKEQHSKNYWNELLKEYRQYSHVIDSQIQLNEKLQTTAEKKLQELSQVSIIEQSEEEIKHLNEEITKLNLDNETLLKQDLSTLLHKQDKEEDVKARSYMDVKQGQISVNQLAIELIRADKGYKLLELQLISTPAYTQLEGLYSELNLLKEKVSNIQNSLEWLENYQDDKKKFIEKNKTTTTLNNTEVKQVLGNINALLTKIKNLEERASLLQQELSKSAEGLSKTIKARLKARQGVFVNDLDSVHTFFSEAMKSFEVLATYLTSLAKSITSKFLGLSWPSFLSIFILGLVLILFRYAGVLALDICIEKEKRAGFSFTLFDFFLLIVKRNWVAIWVCLSFFAFNLFIGLSYSAIKPIIALCLVWFIFRFAGALSRILLLERISDACGEDVRLYHHLKIVLIIGGLISGLTILSYNLAMSEIIRDILYRLFMAFLLVASMVLYFSRNVIPSILPKSVRKTRPYLSKAVGVFSSVLPLGIFACAFIGIVGYLNLAWILSGYLAITLLLLALYIVARGLLIDLMSLISEQVIKTLKNGWVISEVFLKPIDALSRLILVLLFILLLLSSYGLGQSSAFYQKLQQVLAFRLVDFATMSITVQSFVEFLFLAAFFIWLVKWTHEFCYRYLYRNIRDLGIRNSLATFTQYAVITLGVVFTLRVLGIDLSGMSYVLGGLAVGMGFGLRDFASNIVGGIILLIERPLKEGDVVAFDAFEGRVEHIGIRSIRMRSWDNMQVLIPNSETFNKPFTNWTHQDSIVRTVVPIKVHRSDSPTQVQRLIIEALEIIPEVLRTPEPQVLLKNIDEVLYEFELRYYINIDNSSRTGVRSTVLFALCSQFTAAGIKSPIPSMQIEKISENDQE